MPRPKISDDLVESIWGLLENDPRATAGKILHTLGRWAERQGIKIALPSERSIARIKRGYVGKDPEERRLYRWVSWPEDMLSGELPWESSRAVLDLLSYFRECGYQKPTIQNTLWFWRITLAAPDLAIEKRFDLGFRCARMSLAPDSSIFRGLEGYLAIAPWRSKKASALYDKLTRSGAVPKIPSLLSINSPAAAKWRPGQLVRPSVTMEMIGQFGVPWLNTTLDEHWKKSGYATLDELSAKDERTKASQQKSASKTRKEKKSEPL